MEREQLDRLLAQYATGGLTEEERKTLFTAALTDQDLFDQLMDEDALRETIEMPGARNRFIDSLQEELVEAETMTVAGGAMMQMPMAAAPAPEPVMSRAPQPKRQAPQPSMWLAWAAGIGIVFVSGAVTYMLFDRPVAEQVAQVTSSAPKDTKPFVPPPSAVASQKPKETVVEEPPKIMAENRAPLPPVTGIPLPSAAPPPAPARPAPVVAEAVKDMRSADKVVASRSERDSAQSEFRGQLPQTQQSQPSQQAQQNQAAPVVASPPAPAPSQRADARPSLARPMSIPGSASGAGAGAGRAVAREEKAKEAVPPLSAWRRTGDGVWIRVPEGESVGRHETIGIRYVPRLTGRVVLVDDRGRNVVQRNGRAGEELELMVPAQALTRATGESLRLIVQELPVEAGLVGRVARKDTAVAPVRIILRLR